MLGGSHDYLISQQKSFQIKQDDKFFSKLLSKEKPNNPKGEASFRILYYGGNSGAIPFLWESQPGTPKHPLSLSTLPPLIPPPSYHSIPRSQSTHKNPKPKFPFNFFKRSFSLKKNYVTPTIVSSPSTSSSCSSGSLSPYSDTMKRFIRFQRCFSNSTILCFGVRSSGFCKEAKGSHSKLNKKFSF